MNILNGTSGRDWITAYGAQDQIYPGAGADYIDGGSNAADAVFYLSSPAAVSVSLLTNTGTGGDAEGDVFLNVERVFGSAYNDVLEGNDGITYLYGDAGNDTLTDFAGDDSLDD